MKYLPPILVTGCARSGTSMTAGIIHIGGAFGGRLAGPNTNNPKGMFENRTIVQDIIKPMLRAMDCDPMGQSPLPTTSHLRGMDLKQGIKLRNKVLEVMRKDGLSKEDIWFYKGAKMCLMWPVWQFAFPQGKWVIVRRTREDIIRSCIRTPFMRAFKTQQGWGDWIDQHVQRFEEMTKAMECYEVWPERIIQGDFEHAKNMIDHLGLDWNEEQVRAFVEPKLWKRPKK